MSLTCASLCDWLLETQLVGPAQAGELRALTARFADTPSLLKDLVHRGWLTPYQMIRLVNGEGDELVVGPYRVVDVLGEGAMGRVYKARHIRTDKRVALKIIHKEKLNNNKTIDRFQREILLATQLGHPNIVKAVDADLVKGSYYLAMELIEGIDLARLVKQRGPLPITHACELIRQSALALQHAFEHGVVHRDIKPSNLLITWTPDRTALVKILDFGLARFESENDNSNRLTQVGNLVGTVDYMAPEQAENARTADIRADIYSLGCSLYYLLAGQAPFTGNSAVEKLSARMMGEPPRVRQVRPEVPASLEAMLLKMMARNPAKRFQTPSEVAAALVPFALGQVFPDAEVARAVDAVPVHDGGGSSNEKTGGIWDLAPSHADESGGPASRTRSPANNHTLWMVLMGIGAFLFSVILIVILRALISDKPSEKKTGPGTTTTKPLPKK